MAYSPKQLPVTNAVKSTLKCIFIVKINVAHTSHFQVLAFLKVYVKNFKPLKCKKETCTVRELDKLAYFLASKHFSGFYQSQ